MGIAKRSLRCSCSRIARTSESEQAAQQCVSGLLRQELSHGVNRGAGAEPLPERAPSGGVLGEVRP
jgi:hypothetical protein